MNVQHQAETHPTPFAFLKCLPSLKLPLLGCNQQVRQIRKRLENSEKLVKLLYWKKTPTHSSLSLNCQLPFCWNETYVFRKERRSWLRKFLQHAVQTER